MMERLFVQHRRCKRIHIPEGTNAPAGHVIFADHGGVYSTILAKKRDFRQKEWQKSA